MADASIHIREDLRPAYYDDFRCIMGACQYNCCDDGWNIQFSKRDYLKVKHAPKSPELEELCGKCLGRLRERGHDGMYGEFRPSDAGRCAFHTPEGLCRLQLECGEETLPKVCRIFPRREAHMPSGYLERSLSPACEGVLALLWDLAEGIEFRSDPLPKERWKTGAQKEDEPILLWFSVVREWCVDMLQDRRFPLPQRIFLMGMGLRELAEGEMDIRRWMELAAALPESAGASARLPDGQRELALYLLNCTQTLSGFWLLDPQSRAIRKELLKGVEIKSDGETEEFTITVDDYLGTRARYEERFAGQEHFMENLMVTVFFHLHMPNMSSLEGLWKSYVNFCSLYAVYRFLAVMSCREGASGDRAELFRLMVFASRKLIHNQQRQNALRDELFQHDSATLAHMAILLCG